MDSAPGSRFSGRPNVFNLMPARKHPRIGRIVSPAAGDADERRDLPLHSATATLERIYRGHERVSDAECKQLGAMAAA